ncbi:MAG: cytochrome P450 [Sphingobium sp.]
MENLKCPFHGEDAGDQQALSLDSLITHPDDTRDIDAMEDPVREIAAKLHAMGPVVKGRGVGDPPGSKMQFGDVILPNIFIAAHMIEKECYAAVSWEAALKVYAKSKIFSSKVYRPTFGHWGPILTTMDRPEHPKYRAVVQQGFSPQALEKYKKKVISPVLERRFKDLKPLGRADLIRDLTAHYAYDITSTITGFPVEDKLYIAYLFEHAHQVNTDPEGAAKANAEIKAYAQKKINERRVEPRDDVITMMINSTIDGKPLDDEHLVGLTTNLMIAGIDTVFKQSSSIIYLLLAHPDQFDLLKSDRALIPQFVEEAMRFQGLGNVQARQATEDTELLGVHIPKDAVIFTMHGIAHRDPCRWADPDKFDVLREQKQHMLFSSGAHTCLGKDVARAALAGLIEHLIDDFPNLRFDPDYPRPRITGWTLRAPLTVPVIWDA